jgi:hypothetical protein
LSAGQPAAKVTVRFDDQATGRPAALTVAVLRPELFRIVVQTAEMPLPGGEAGSATGAWPAPPRAAAPDPVGGVPPAGDGPLAGA